MTRYLRISSVAKILDTSKKAVYNMIYNGRIPYVRYSKRNIRISEDDLLEFIKMHHNKSYISDSNLACRDEPRL